MTPRPFEAEDVVALLKTLDRHDIAVVVDGGWAVDALLGRRTRVHQDLDIAIRHGDVPKLRALLDAQGYRDVPQPDTSAFNFVLADPAGNRLDVHTYEFDDQGRHIDGLPYPPDSLSAKGAIAGHPVRCITADWLVAFHTEYEPDDNDFKDVQALCERFAIPLPDLFGKFLKAGARED